MQFKAKGQQVFFVMLCTNMMIFIYLNEENVKTKEILE